MEWVRGGSLRSTWYISGKTPIIYECKHLPASGNFGKYLLCFCFESLPLSVKILKYKIYKYYTNTHNKIARGPCFSYYRYKRETNEGKRRNEKRETFKIIVYFSVIVSADL